eukprot:UN01847
MKNTLDGKFCYTTQFCVTTVAAKLRNGKNKYHSSKNLQRTKVEENHDFSLFGGSHVNLVACFSLSFLNLKPFCL